MDSPPTTNAILTVQQTGQTFPLDQELLTIGRKSENNIILAEDLKVSRHHATISWQADQLVIEDVGSANGTFLNGQRLTPYLPHPLQKGDKLQVGKLHMTVDFE